MTTFVRRHRLAVFFGLTFLLTWWSWPFQALGLAPTAHWTVGPLLAALIVLALTEGRAGFLDLGARMIRWRVGWGPWAFAVLVPLAVLALAAAGNVVVWGAPVPDLAALSLGDLLLVAAVRIVNPLDGPLGEEPGWRGYAVPRLQARYSPLAGALGLGVVVALWHLPLVTTGQLAPIGLPVTFAITIVYWWLFNRSRGSVLLTMVFHIAQGTVAYAALGFTGADAARMDWLTGGLWALLALGLVLGDRAAWRSAPASAVVREQVPAVVR
jgi:membrane protease YdiL (CAAX protease family)